MIPPKRFSGHIYEQKHLNIGYILPLTTHHHKYIPVQSCLKIWIVDFLFFLQRTERIRRNHLAINGDGSKLWPGIKQWSSNELEAMKDSFYGKRTRTTVVSNCWKKWSKVHVLCIYTNTGIWCCIHVWNQDGIVQNAELKSSLQQTYKE